MAKKSHINDHYMERQQTYWQCLGEFVDEFARVENMIRHFLSRMGATNGAVGAALLSGVRVDQAISLTNRVFEARNDPLGRSALEKYFLQLGSINKLRNELLHHGGHLDWGNDGIIVSNFNVAFTRERLRQFTMTVKDMRDAISDLKTIYWVFVLCFEDSPE